MTLIIEFSHFLRPDLFRGEPVTEERRCCCTNSSSSSSSNSSSGSSSSGSSGAVTSSSSFYSSALYEETSPLPELLPFPTEAVLDEAVDENEAMSASDTGWLLDPETGVERRVVFMRFADGDAARQAVTDIVTSL